jgi:P4 family phage/plasmid primase-like protien
MQENIQSIGSIRDEALFYVSLGYPIIPLCPSNHRGMSVDHLSRCKSPGKAPLIKNWTNWSATTKEDIYSWFRDAQAKGADINIGIPLGTPSGLIGVDLDGRGGEIVLLALSNGNLPRTLEYSTGNGRRLLYKLPTGMQTKKIKISGKEPHEELAILGNLQQTVLPPSLHSSGVRYTWKQGCSPRDISAAEAPQWLLEKLQAGYEPEKREKVTEEDWTRTLTEGQRNDGITRLAGSLIARMSIENLSIEEIKKSLYIYNSNYCQPPLEEKEIDIIAESVLLREEQSQAKKGSTFGEEPQKPKLNPTPFIKHFLISQKERGLIWKYSTETGRFVRCDELSGPWKFLDLDYVKSELRRDLIDGKNGGHIVWDKINCVNECVEALKAELAIQSEFGIFDLGYSLYNNIWKYNPLDIICVNNGIYHWRDQKFLPWSADVYSTVKLPVDYDIKAKCPHWEKVLTEWIPDCESIKFLQEFIGLCLIPDTSFRTAVFLYGTGSNGKSMFLDTVKSIFGDALVSIPLHRLMDRFETVYLQNKLINICGDVDSKYITETGVLKSIIGGDINGLHGELKHGKSFDFTSVCRLIFSTNSLPRVEDKTVGWLSRWKYIEFPHMFPVNPSYKIEHELLFNKEKSGILNWAIEGLIRLKSQNKWTESVAMKSSELQYRTENDNVAAFLEEYIESVKFDGSPMTMCSSSVLHKCYREWVDQYLAGMKPVSINEFSKRIQANCFKKDIRNINGKSTRVFLGMAVKEEFAKNYKGYLFSL